MNPRGPDKKIAGVVLGAGRSTRMRGVNKLLVPMGGVPAVAAVCLAALEAKLSPLVVVIGHQGREVREAVEGSCRGLETAPRFVSNPDYRKGRMSSIAAAVKALRGDCDAALFLRGDQPWISPSLISGLTEAYRAGDYSMAFPVHDGRKGSPTIVRARHFDRLLALGGDHGTLELAHELWDSSAKLAIDDPRCLRGIDTPEDLLELGF